MHLGVASADASISSRTNQPATTTAEEKSPLGVAHLSDEVEDVDVPNVEQGSLEGGAGQDSLTTLHHRGSEHDPTHVFLRSAPFFFPSSTSPISSELLVINRTYIENKRFFLTRIGTFVCYYDDYP